MNRFTLMVAALIALTGGLSTANAAVILNDNFDSYNQASFEAAWTPIGTVAPQSAQISTAQSSSAPQSVHVPGTASNSQYRNQRTFAETSTLSTSGNMGIGDQLIWSFDFYDSNPTGAPQRNYANLQDSTAPGGTNQLISMGMNNNQTATNSGGQFYMARILGYTVPTTADPDGGPAESVGGASAYFKLNDFGVGQRTLGWHNLKTVISTNDGNSLDYEFYVDNVLAERVSNVGTAATIRSWDNIRIGSGLSNGSVEAFFDNMYLEYIPAVVNTPPSVVSAIYGPPYNANDPGSLTHQFAATDAETPSGPFTWDQLTLLSYTANYGGAGAGPFTAPTLSSSGEFVWDSVGSPRGDYVWRVRATDGGNASGTGTITVHVNLVPEPTSFALVSLATLGLAFASRRRLS